MLFCLRLTGLTLLLCAGLFSPAAAARDPSSLEPAGKWHVDWTPTTCRLARGFGDPKAPDILAIERFGPTDRFQLIVLSRQVRSYQQDATLQLRFGDGPLAATRAIPGDGKTMASIFIPSASLARPGGGEKPQSDFEWDEEIRVTPEREAAVTTLELRWRGRSLVFRTGPLDKAFAALRACTNDLVKTWGLDPVQQATLSKWPKPVTRPSGWVGSLDYPQGMLSAGKQAIVNFRLMVDTEGKPTACEVQRSYADKLFDQITCSTLMRRARFEPALDAQGTPVPSFYLNTVTWIMAAP